MASINTQMCVSNVLVPNNALWSCSVHNPVTQMERVCVCVRVLVCVCVCLCQWCTCVSSRGYQVYLMGFWSFPQTSLINQQAPNAAKVQRVTYKSVACSLHLVPHWEMPRLHSCICQHLADGKCPDFTVVSASILQLGNAQTSQLHLPASCSWEMPKLHSCICQHLAAGKCPDFTVASASILQLGNAQTSQLHLPASWSKAACCC